jgi:sugar-phosphatase
VRNAHGRPSLSTVRDYLPDADHDMANREVEQREIEDTEGVVPLPGARELLEGLPHDRWTIVTSCTRPLAEARLGAAGIPIPDKIVTSSDVQNGKPHPEPFLKAALALGLAPGDCIVVEDAPAGIRGGKAAGSRVIGIRTNVPDSVLAEAGADWIVDSCADISVARAGAALKLSLRPANHAKV